MEVGFTGLTMPVFNAFGWAGEEPALKFAWSQLEMFIRLLHVNLSREAQTLLPFFGVDRESNTIYLARSQDVESDIHIVFYARPMALRLSIDVNDRQALNRGLKSMAADMLKWHRTLKELEGEWHLHIQQMEYDSDSGRTAHYKDLFKGMVAELTIEGTTELFERAAYLNNEERWLAPIYLSRSYISEFISVMGTSVVEVMAKEVQKLLPLLMLMTGAARRPALKAKGKGKGKTEAATESVSILADYAGPTFTYIATVKPLHIRKGFINLEPHHWSFFAINSRSETRPVTVHYEGSIDKDSSVWRLAQSEMTRLVLGHHAHAWLEENCAPDEKVKLTVIKSPEDEIDIEIQLIS